MAKLTKEQTKQHEEAEALLSLDRALTDEEKAFVYDNFWESARWVNSKSSAFFTPLGLARTLVSYAAPRDGKRILDLCGGIGVLAFAVSKRAAVDLVVVEYNQDYIDIGRRLVPEARWVRADVFEQDVWRDLGRFDMVVANPPFGASATDADLSWLRFRQKSKAHLMAVEISLRVSDGDSAFILPQIECPVIWRDGAIDSDRPPSRAYQAFVKQWPDVCLETLSESAEGYRGQWHGTAPCVEMVSVHWDGPDIPPVA